MPHVYRIFDLARFRAVMELCRDISACIARAVIKTAVSEGCCSDPGTLKAAKKGDDALLHRIKLKMWVPEYKSLLNRKGLA